MRIFLAGASGALGRRLVPLLHASGHEVVAMTRSPEKQFALRAAGAEPVIADGLDRAAVVNAVVRAEPDVVVHQMTGLSGVTSFRHLDEELALTNRLRTEGIDNLLAAARAARVGRVIAQSYGLWRYEGDGPLHAEDDRLDPRPPATMARTLDAIRHAESAVAGAEGLDGVVLRYGFFYGPGTGISDDGGIAGLVRAGKFPVIGDGTGVWSFVHTDDAAAATLAAIRSGARGVYNVADDEPSPIGTWLPDLASALGAEPPRRVSRWVGLLAAGRSGVYLHTRIGGLSNAKAKRELGWQPAWASHRLGFRAGLGDLPVPVPDPRAAA